MAFLEKLSHIFGIEINSPIISVNVNSHNQSKDPNKEKEFLFDSESGEFEILMDNISEDKKELLSEALKESIDKEDTKVFEKETWKLLEGLKKFERSNADKQLINFFKPIISFADFEVLEAAIYIQESFKQGNDVRSLKRDIRFRFGDRGNNIVNLFSAGYFEEFLTKVYSHSKEKFNEIYELVVSKAVLAVFVHSETDKEDIPKEIYEKLSLSKKYGIKFIYIHGIGEVNVKKIRECIKENKKFFKFFEKEIYEEAHIIIVELLLK